MEGGAWARQALPFCLVPFWARRFNLSGHHAGSLNGLERKEKGQRSVEEGGNRVVAALGFNNGVTDPRQKVVFHTLRHTFASWLVEQSVDLYSVKELMGHSTLAMTERYSHLSPDKLRRAVKTLEAGMDAAKARGKVVKIGEK